jgi:hypothetical protein
MFMSLLSLLGGGLMRALPEVFSFLNKKTDNAHELAMLDRQLQIEQQRAQYHMEEVKFQGNVDETIAMLDAQREALQGQMQKLGIWWVDALNFLVRPLTTYYFLGCYGIVKTATIAVALQSFDAWNAIIQCWTLEDSAILSGILGFWFVGRVFDKKS